MITSSNMAMEENVVNEVSHVNITNSVPLGRYNVVSFKEWVDEKYNSTNLMSKYEDPEEMREFLQQVIDCSEQYNAIILPEYSTDYVPDMDLTKPLIRGTVIGTSYYEDGIKIDAREFINNFIKTEIMEGETPLTYLRLVNILSD